MGRSGSGLDELKSRWQKAFKLPNTDRKYVEDNQINYWGTVNFKGGANFQTAISGVGDTIIDLGLNLHSSQGQRISLRSALSPPSSGVKKALGSGTKAVSTFLAASKIVHFLPFSGVLRVGVGTTLSDRSAKVDARRRRAAASGYVA